MQYKNSCPNSATGEHTFRYPLYRDSIDKEPSVLEAYCERCWKRISQIENEEKDTLVDEKYNSQKPIDSIH